MYERLLRMIPTSSPSPAAQREAKNLMIGGTALIVAAIIIGYIAQHAADTSAECLILDACDISTGVFAVILILGVVGFGLILYGSSKAQLRRPGLRVEVVSQASPAPMAAPHHSSGASAPAPFPNDTTRALEELAELHRRGLITTEEFQSKKSDILRRM